MTTLSLHHHRRVAPAAGGRQPSMARLIVGQVGYALRDLWRGRIAFVFTFLFPLTWLLVLGALIGNDTVDDASGVRVMQFVTPTAAVMGVLYGTFPTVASSLAEARERGVLKRFRGTPLPPSAYLVGRVGAAVVLALGSLLLMLAVGVVAYDVQIQWDTAPATAVTVVCAIASFAALGLAVAALARSSVRAQALSIGGAVILALISGVMGGLSDLPTWMDRVAAVFPLKPFNDAVGEQFDPYASGAGWDLPALALILAWGLAGVLVAVRGLSQEPGVRSRRRPTSVENRRGNGVDVPRSATPVPSPVLTAVRHADAAPPKITTMVLRQVAWSTRSALRDPGWVFFAVAMPVALYLFSGLAWPTQTAEASPPLGLQLATGMVAWAVMVNLFVTMPEAIARARDTGLLKRLRGTPLHIGAHFAGRFTSALLLVLVTAALIFAAGPLWFDLEVSLTGIPLALGVLVLGSGALGACGLLFVSLLRSSKAVTAVGLGVALPIAFFSDVFAIGQAPDWMTTAGSLFPLKHLTNSLAWALDPAGPTLNAVSLMVMAVWLLASIRGMAGVIRP